MLIDNYELNSTEPLQYRDTIENDLLDLIEFLYRSKINNEAEELYTRIKNKIYDDINFKDLSVNIILTDLREIRQVNMIHSMILEELILNPLESLDDIGNMYGITKQAVSQILMKYASKYEWISNLKLIRRRWNEKGFKNNSTGKNGRKKVLMQQLDMFDEIS